MPGEVFVGRGSELGALVAASRSALAGAPQLWLVSGPPGVGKSALVRAVLRQAPLLAVRRAAAEGSERTLAYGVVDQLVGMPSAPPAADRPEPVEVGARLLGELAPMVDQGGLALVVEDVQWADGPSLQAITFALRRLRRDPVLTILTCRSGEVDHLPQGLRRLVSDEGQELALQGLADGDLVDLAAALGRGPLSRRAAHRLRRHTDGSPLHATAVLRQLGAAQLEATPATSMPVPRSYAGLVLGQLAGCSTEAQQLVAAVAVLGPQAGLGPSTQLAGLADPAVALDEVIDSELLVLDRGRSQLAFPHHLARSAVYDSLPAGHRCELHARAVTVVDGEEAALRHRLAACLGVDGDLARHAVGVARRWEAEGRWAAAADTFLRAATVSPVAAERERCTLAAVNCLLQVGDLAEAVAHAAEVEQLPPSAGRYLVRGRLAMFTGDTGQADRLLTRAWESCDSPDGDLVAAQAAGDMAHLAVNQGRAAEAAMWVERASATGRPPADAATLYALAMGAQGRAGDQLAALPPEPEVGDELSPAQLDTLVARGVLELWIDELASARRALARAEAGLARRGPLHLRLIALFYLADAEYRMGAWPDAVLHSQLATSLARDADQVWMLALVHGVAAFPLAAMGQWQAADGHARASETARRLGSDLLWSSMAKARVAQARRDPEAMYQSLRPVDALGDLAGTEEPGIQPWASLMAEALVGLGRLDEAEERLKGVQARAELRHHPTELVRAARIRGQLLLARRRVQDAAEVLRDASSLDPAVRCPLEHALVDLTRGAALRRLGKRRAAMADLEAAHDRLAALGAVPYLERCREEEAATGLAPRARTAPAGTRLTTQEQSVAALVASGLTNRQAAERLVVSVKTVEYHLGHVFAKLGVTSRLQMAAKLRGSAGDGQGAPAGQGEAASGAAGEEGGDPACWADLVCAECGAVTGDGPHRPGCPAAAGQPPHQSD